MKTETYLQRYGDKNKFKDLKFIQLWVNFMVPNGNMTKSEVRESGKRKKKAKCIQTMGYTSTFPYYQMKQETTNCTTHYRYLLG